VYRYALFDLFGTLIDEEGRALTGAAELLASLPADRWAIVTSCPRRLALALIAHAGLPEPRVLVSADDVQRGKPAPECYLAAAAAFDAPPNECVAIEDSTGGIAAARAAGIDVIAILRGRSSEFAHAASYTARTIADVRVDLAD
jgi:sugar-phosphatase